jgi:DNA modification methylase
MEVCGIDLDFEKQNGYFINADCMDGMKEFPDKYFDLAIVDPPYGLGIGHPVNDSVTIIGGGW